LADQPQPTPAPSRAPAESQPPAPGGVSLSASDDVTIGGDVVGRDKVTNITNVYQVTGVASSEAVGQGLVALKELMQRSADVRTAVTAFQTDFQAAEEQLILMADYKSLHDLLHRLQFHCYNGVVQAATRFPDDEMALSNLADYQLELEGILTELKTVAGRPALPKQETVWIVELNAADDELKSVLDTLDDKQLKKVIWRMNRVLANQPARINSRLNQAARTLRLPALTQALTQVCANLTSLDLDPEKVGQFQTGVEALSQLDQQLAALVDDHDRLQEVEVELRRIEASLEADLTELEMSWPDLKAKVEPLSGAGSTEEWVVAFQTEGKNLDEALAANNPPKVKRAFRSYRRRAGDRCYRVDVNLKDMCERLRSVAGPLASVLRMIE